MKTGRNDPCPCGSGKKYKKCCYEKDLETERQEIDNLSELEYAGLLPRQTGQDHFTYDDTHEHDDWQDEDEVEAEWVHNPENRQTWLRFVGLPFHDKIDVIVKLLSGELIEKNIPIIDMLQELAGCAHSEPDIADYFSLLDKIRKDHSLFYNKHEFVILNDCIQICIEYNLPAQLEKYFIQLSAIANQNIDDYQGLCIQLSILDQLPLLVKGYKIACKKLLKRRYSLSIAEDMFLMSHDDYCVLDFLDKNPGATFDSQAFQQFLTDMGLPYDCEEYASFFPEFAQTAKWIIADFNIRNNKDLYEGKFWNCLSRLGGSFIPWLHSNYNISLAKANILNVFCVSFILNRLSGKVEPGFTWRNIPAMTRDKKVDYNYIANTLCPDDILFVQECQKMIEGSFFDTYRLAALLESIPYWLLYLKSLGLLDDMTLERKIQELKSVFYEKLPQVCLMEIEEMMPIDTINQAWQKLE